MYESLGSAWMDSVAIFAGACGVSPWKAEEDELHRGLGVQGVERRPIT